MSPGRCLLSASYRPLPEGRVSTLPDRIVARVNSSTGDLNEAIQRRYRPTPAGGDFLVDWLVYV